ncbi:site-specific tyrosine recombinase XerD [Gemmata sp. SH-PL17]|uniref:tyrosine-type recombinase/integrase n=1 Tax=Gemmata sp. SH-PL17 TaxID=1630693 RepID=UPI00078E82E9|nr:site-specific integrase [Gemmata sp. SH-PL17]AMV27354.1 site-specific tyrosine recombinase XerD [Gemmata sp. SH-PL17]
MARPKNPTPTYKHHKATGLARCWVNGRWVSLGKFNSPESRAEFARIIAELSHSPSVPVRGKSPRTPPTTIDQVMLAFFAHAAKHYVTRTGKPSEEYNEFRRAARPLHALYGHIPASDFGPRALATVRAEMVKTGLSRNVVNQRIGRIVRAFKWAVAEELVPVTVFEALRTLKGLQRGRTEARETDPITPVPAHHVTATLRFLNAHISAMIELQRLTGCRPGEICALRMADVDASDAVWLYRPVVHKTEHHGFDRVIPFGPRAQLVLRAFLDARPVEPAAPVFSPARAREERFALSRTRRKTKVPPSQVSRRNPTPLRVPAAQYSAHSFSQAVRKAALKALVPHWHPNQLRHAYATDVRRRFGLEAAQVLLGHASANVTQVYAERDLARALQVAREVG